MKKIWKCICSLALIVLLTVPVSAETADRRLDMDSYYQYDPIEEQVGEIILPIPGYFSRYPSGWSCKYSYTDESRNINCLLTAYPKTVDFDAGALYEKKDELISGFLSSESCRILSTLDVSVCGMPGFLTRWEDESVEGYELLFMHDSTLYIICSSEDKKGDTTCRQDILEMIANIHSPVAAV